MSRYSFVQYNYLSGFIESEFPGCLDKNLHIKDITEAVIKAFPVEVNEDVISKELGISGRWMQKILKDNLGITLKRLRRILRVYAALNLLYENILDNYDIAIRLNYTEVKNMTRDFRKELHICPAEARGRLALVSPKQLFDKLWKK